MRRLALVVGLATGFACADVFSPGARVSLSIQPVFSGPVFELLSGDLTQLRIRITRLPSPPGGVVLDTTVAIDTSGTADLSLSVPLFAGTEDFEIFLQGLRGSDGAVLYSGIDTVIVSNQAPTPPTPVPVSYVGHCGATAGCTITVAPQDTSITLGGSFVMRYAVDSSGSAVAGVPIALTNLTPGLILVASDRRVTALLGTGGGAARVLAAIRGDSDTLRLTVSPPVTGVPTKLAFAVQPAATVAGAAIAPAVQVTVQDALGNTVTAATNAITIAIGTNPAGGTLSGTATASAVGGVATFSTLSIDKAGIGYTLTASATGLTGATSGSFGVTAGAAAAVIVTPGYATVRAVAPSNTVQLADTVKDAFGNLLSPGSAAWTSRSPSVATVSGTGLVTAVGRGTAVIVAAAGSGSDSTLVAVGDPTLPGDPLVLALTNGRAFGAARVGQHVPVDVIVDFKAVPTDLLGSYTAQFNWNGAVLHFDSTQAGTFVAPTVNSDSATFVRFAAVDANGAAGVRTLVRLWFTVVGVGSSAQVLDVTEMSAVSPTFTDFYRTNHVIVASGGATLQP